MKRWSLLACLAVLTAPQARAAPVPEPVLPPKAQAALQHAREYLEVDFHPEWLPAQAGNDLDAALDTLGGVNAGTLKALARREGEGLDAKLLAIALDRRQRPDAYRELADRYRGGRRGTVFAPKAEHAKEEWRLVWE